MFGCVAVTAGTAVSLEGQIWQISWRAFTVRGCYSRWVTEISDHGACQSRIDGDSFLHVSDLPEILSKGFRTK